MKKYFLAILVAEAVIGIDALRLRRDRSLAPEAIQTFASEGLAVGTLDAGSSILQAITPNLWMNFESQLISTADSRYVGSATISASEGMIVDSFRNAGLSVSFDEFPNPAGNGNARNIVGKLTGSTGESILVGAHYDDLPKTGAAPGADDNASGVATMLSVVHALSNLTEKLSRNVIFVAFSGEEQGMVGSSHFVRSVAPSLNITAAIVLDQNGNPGTSHGIILESVGHTQDKQRIIDTLADSVDATIGSVVVNYHGFGSDHVPLSEFGIPAVLVIERENMQFAKQYGHTSKDDLSHIDESFGSAIARTVARAVIRLASA